MSLSIRPATPEDKWDVHSWRNTKKVRSVMLNKGKISASEHDMWYDNQLANPSYSMLILEKDGVPQAVQIYFDIIPNNTTWWAFYFTPFAPSQIGPMLKIWKTVELSGLAYAFDVLKCEQIFIEVLRSNFGVLNWHKRFGFLKCDENLSKNTKNFDLEVMNFDRSTFESRAPTTWSAELEHIREAFKLRSEHTV